MPCGFYCAVDSKKIPAKRTQSYIRYSFHVERMLFCVPFSFLGLSYHMHKFLCVSFIQRLPWGAVTVALKLLRALWPKIMSKLNVSCIGAVTLSL